MLIFAMLVHLSNQELLRQILSLSIRWLKFYTVTDFFGSLPAQSLGPSQGGH